MPIDDSRVNELHDPALLAGALAAVEASVNKALALAPASQRELEEMAGSTIAIEITSPETEVFIAILEDGRLGVASYTEAKIAVRVKGSLEAFAQLVTSEDPAATLINSDLEIIGNSTPLIALQQVISKMDVDWEAPLVDALGDVAGHQLANFLRGAFSWGTAAASSLRRQLSEYILEEGRLSPPQAELEYFYDEIHKLGLRVDRVQSRAARLAKRVDALLAKRGGKS